MQLCRLGLLLNLLFLIGSSHARNPADLDPAFQNVIFERQTNAFYFGVRSIALQPDGKIVIAGAFGKVNGLERNGLARLLPNGALDLSFVPPPGTNRFEIKSVALQPDGKVLVSHPVTKPDGSQSGNVARLNSDGSYDPTFESPAHVAVSQIIVGPDGKVYIAGAFYDIPGLPDRYQHYLARLLPSGAFDQTYRPPIGGFGTAAESGEVEMLMQPDGKIVLGGVFTTRDGPALLARFDTNGPVDQSFTSPAEVTTFCQALALQPDGKILHGFMRWRTTADGSDTYAHVSRYNPDRTRDATFQENLEVPGTVRALALQRDGKILAGGSYYTPSHRWPQHLVRFHPNGARDDTLSFGQAFAQQQYSGEVADVVVQPDGKILMGGTFLRTAVDGTQRMHLLRLRGDPAYLREAKLHANSAATFLWTVLDESLAYRVERSTDLRAWEPAPEARREGNQIQLDHSAQDQTYFRLQAE